jgi:hypothetical protein
VRGSAAGVRKCVLSSACPEMRYAAGYSKPTGLFGCHILWKGHTRHRRRSQKLHKSCLSREKCAVESSNLLDLFDHHKPQRRNNTAAAARQRKRYSASPEREDVARKLAWTVGIWKNNISPPVANAYRSCLVLEEICCWVQRICRFPRLSWTPKGEIWRRRRSQT